MGDDLPDYELGINVLKQALATLQAEVTQLATVNVDVVAQSLSDLSAVVSATALDIRALAASDVPHRSLPYSQTTFQLETVPDREDESTSYEKPAVQTFDYYITDIDWYCYGMDNEPLVKQNEGILSWAQLEVLNGSWATIGIFLRRWWSAEIIRPGYETDQWVFTLVHDPFEPILVKAGNRILFWLKNHSGQTIDWDVKIAYIKP